MNEKLVRNNDFVNLSLGQIIPIIVLGFEFCLANVFRVTDIVIIQTENIFCIIYYMRELCFFSFLL